MQNARAMALPLRSRGRLSPATKLALFLWALFPLLFPVYLFARGRPQISSFVIVMTFLVAAAGGLRFQKGSSRIIGPLSWFVWYVCLVNIVWALWSGNLLMLVPPTYYLFNAIAFIIPLALYARSGTTFLRCTQHAVAISVLLQVVFLVTLGSDTVRAAIFFNNPNQLGYFALVSAALFLAVADTLKSELWYRCLILTACIYLALMSSSFAAVGGLGVLVVLLFRGRPVVAILALVTVLGLFKLREEPLFIEERVGNEQAEMEQTTFLASRGYDRIIIYSERIFFGAGEGNYRDYSESAIGKHEIHSSYGTVLFSYGIIGAALFALFLGRLVSRGGINGLQYLAPVLLYGIAHQGLRSPMLWVFFAIMWVVGDGRSPYRIGRLRGGSERRTSLLHNSRSHPNALGTR